MYIVYGVHGRVCTQLILIAIGIENITRNASAQEIESKAKEARHMDPAPKFA